MNTKRVLMGVLAGAATGAVFGMLLAPHKGKSTRKMIIDKGESFLTRMDKIMNGYAQIINKKFDNLKMEVTEMGSNGEAKLDGTLSDIIKNKIK